MTSTKRPTSSSPSAPKTFRLEQRSSGLLLHPTSLPGAHGSGDLGKAAYSFVDFLSTAGQGWWQMLPTGPVGAHGTPYDSPSAFAGNPLLISLDRLHEQGLLTKRDIEPAKGLRSDRVHFATVGRFRADRLRRAFRRFRTSGQAGSEASENLYREHRFWLDDYVMFAALKRRHRGCPWTDWDAEVRSRRPDALRRAAKSLAEEIEFERFVQFEHHVQWTALADYCHRRGVGLIGDIPIFVSHDSADVWAHQKLFQLDELGRPLMRSGVPPDAFSKTGQLWGHPLYRWEAHIDEGFAWWIERFRMLLTRFDAARIDHFLGFVRCWGIPGDAKTAVGGSWQPTPGAELLSAVRRALGQVEIIAEDLGLLTPQAAALREKFGFPGMRVMHFGFNGGRYHQPHNYPRRCVGYTGTHDNDTTVGWFEQLGEIQGKPMPDGLPPRERALRYLASRGRDIHWDMIRALMQSHADLAIVPVQDVLGLDSSARMNVPGTKTGNWQWRMADGALTSKLAQQLRELTEAYERVRDPRAPGS